MSVNSADLDQMRTASWTGALSLSAALRTSCCRSCRLESCWTNKQNNIIVLVIKQLLSSSKQCVALFHTRPSCKHKGQRSEIHCRWISWRWQQVRAQLWRGGGALSWTLITLDCILAVLNWCALAHLQRLMAAARCFFSLRPSVAHQREPLCRPLSLCTAALHPTQTASSTCSFLNTCFSLIRLWCCLLRWKVPQCWTNLTADF